jgi:hypothetical protein
MTKISGFQLALRKIAKSLIEGQPLTAVKFSLPVLRLEDGQTGH